MDTWRSSVGRAMGSCRGVLRRPPSPRTLSSLSSNLNLGMAGARGAAKRTQHVTVGGGRDKALFQNHEPRTSILAMSGAGWSTIESDPGVFTVSPGSLRRTKLSLATHETLPAAHHPHCQAPTSSRCCLRSRGRRSPTTLGSGAHRSKRSSRWTTPSSPTSRPFTASSSCSSGRRRWHKRTRQAPTVRPPFPPDYCVLTVFGSNISLSWKPLGPTQADGTTGKQVSRTRSSTLRSKSSTTRAGRRPCSTS